ncbi:MAG TPA: hypothetical protein DCL15_14110 [Chloroflexi bacterium]|nr:hypothetical protein [Chloroflexota bacterium]HHW88745.1 hypothetical protein [Chloroflexota bacterium]
MSSLVFARWRRGMLRTLLLVMLCLAPLQTVQAAPATQDAPRPLLLGEFGNAKLAKGESVAYALTTPLDGTYTVAFTADGDAADFLLTLVDADGNTLYDDALQTNTVIDLSAGDYVLTFTAQADAELAFLVGIEAGSMSTDPDAPGELFNGAVFTTNDVTDPLHATVTLEPSPYPQQALILVQGEAGDVYDVEVTNEDFDYYYTNTAESEVLQFVSQGGVYALTVTPTEGGASLQVSVFLSGPAPTLEFDVETPGELNSAEDTDTYQFTVAEIGTVIAVTASTDTDASLTLNAGTTPDAQTWSAYSYANEPATLEFIAPAPGVYYVSIQTDAEAGGAYTILVEDKGKAGTLPLNEPTQDSVPSGGHTGYLFEVTEPEQFVIVLLAGPADKDLDLNIMHYIDGEQVASDSAASSSGREVAGLFIEKPGTILVDVNGSWADGADFTILAFTGPLTDLLGESITLQPDASPGEGVGADSAGTLEQWAVAAEASSQYTDDSWSAQQATGAADTPEAGDIKTAWAAASADVEAETLVLVYAQSVNPTGIEIYESYNPGAVARIEVLDPNTDDWVVVWEGVADTAGKEIAVFRPPLTPVDFATDQVRLTIDEPLIPGWNEIDAVKLIGVAE